MHSHSNSRASSRLRKAKSSSSDYQSYTRTEQGAHLSAAIAHLHALTAAEVAFESARGTNKVRERKSTSSIRNQGVGRKESVRYTGPNASPLLKRSITKRRAKNWDNVQYGKSTKTLEYKTEGYSPLLQRDYLTDRTARRPTLSDVSTTSTSIRKAKSLLPALGNGSQILSASDQRDEQSLLARACQSSECTDSNTISSLGVAPSPPPSILKDLYSSDSPTHDRLLAHSRDQYLRQVTVENLSLHNRATASEKPSKSKPFAKTVRTSSANRYGPAISSTSCAPPPRTRVFSMRSARRKLKKLFKKETPDYGQIPDQQVSAERPHFGFPTRSNDNRLQIWSPPPAPGSDVVYRLDARPETPIRTPVPVQNANRGTPVRRDETLKSTDSLTSQSEQRRELSGTSTWERSSIEASYTTAPPDPNKPKRPLTTIQEGQTYQPSSSRNGGTNTCSTRYKAFRAPMNNEQSGKLPIDPSRLASLIRRKKSKGQGLGLHSAASTSHERLITPDLQGEVAYINEQDLAPRYSPSQSHNPRLPSNPAPDSYGVRHYQPLQHFTREQTSCGETERSTRPWAARDQIVIPPEDVPVSSQALRDKFRNFGYATVLRNPEDAFSEDSGSIYSREPDGTRIVHGEDAWFRRAQRMRQMSASPLLPASPLQSVGYSSGHELSDGSSPDMVSIDAARMESARLRSMSKDIHYSPQTVDGVRRPTTIESAKLTAKMSSIKASATSKLVEVPQTPTSSANVPQTSLTSARLAKTPTVSGDLTRPKRGHRKERARDYGDGLDLSKKLLHKPSSTKGQNDSKPPDPETFPLAYTPPDHEQSTDLSYKDVASAAQEKPSDQLPASPPGPSSINSPRKWLHGLRFYPRPDAYVQKEYALQDPYSAPLSVDPPDHEQLPAVGPHYESKNYGRNAYNLQDPYSTHPSSDLPNHEQLLQMRSPSKMNVPKSLGDPLSVPVLPSSKAPKMPRAKIPDFDSEYRPSTENQKPSNRAEGPRNTKNARQPSTRQYSISSHSQSRLTGHTSQHPAATNLNARPLNDYTVDHMGYEDPRRQRTYHQTPCTFDYGTEDDSPLARYSSRTNKVAASKKYPGGSYGNEGRDESHSPVFL